MKLIYLFTLILLSVGCRNLSNKNEDSQSAKDKSGIEFKVVQKGALSNFSDIQDVNNYYNVEFKLINHTDSDLDFFTLSCTSLITIVTDAKDEVKFLQHKCSSNSGTLIILKPNQEYSIPAVFISNKYNTVRFGFVLCGVEYKQDLKKNGLSIAVDPIDELKRMRDNLENVIWTENITLLGTSFRPFEIRNIINDSTFSIVHLR